MSYKASVGIHIALSILFFNIGCIRLQAQTPFDVTVLKAGPSFAHIQDIQPPANAGTNRKTIARMITLDSGGPGADVNAITFQLVPQAAANMSTAGPITIGTHLTGAVTQTVAPNATVADLVKATKIASSNGYAIIEFEIDYTDGFDFGGAPATWDLQAQKQSADREYNGFWVTAPGDAATVSTMVQLPKIKPIPAVSYGDVQINLPDDQVPFRKYTIQNLGTGPLQNINSSEAPGGLNPPGGAHGIVSVNLSNVDVGGSLTETVKFKPTALGSGNPNTVTMHITSNDPASPMPVSFGGNGVTLDAILLQDVSGSMGWLPDGTQNAPPNCVPGANNNSQSRLCAAKDAGKQLFQEYRRLTGGQARFGLTTFPNPTVDAQIPSASRVVPIDTADNVLGPVTNALADSIPPGIQAGGWTPTAEGIKFAQQDLNNSTGSYRPVILLFTDGGANVDSTDPPKTPDDWIAAGSPLQNKGIRMFTVGYGVPGSADVDHSLLQRLANATNPPATNPPGITAYFDANSTDFTQLKKGFRNAVRQWIGLNDVADPRSTITAGQQKTHAVCIDDSARAIVFVVDWDQNQTDAITFTVVSPQGVTVTPSQNATVHKGDTYAMWVVTGDLVRLGAGAGQWTLNLTGSSGLSGTLNYAYNVQVQSFVNTEPTFSKAIFATNEVPEFTVPLDMLKSDLQQQAKVTLTYRAPQQSFNNWLSKSKVDPAWIVGPVTDTRTRATTGNPAPQAQSTSYGGPPHAPDTIMGERATLAQKKAWALTNIAKTPFPNQFTQGTIELHNNGAGVFTARGPEIAVEGRYQFNISILSQPNVNIFSCYQRSFTYTSIATVAMSPARVAGVTQWQNVKPSPFFDQQVTQALNTPVPPGMVRRMVVTTPRDRLGNYFGAGNAQAVKLQLGDAKAIGAPQDLLDGSYAQIVEYSKRAKPQATVTVGNVTSNSTRPGPRCPFFHWLWYLFGGR